jgi:hypothetical protein
LADYGIRKLDLFVQISKVAPDALISRPFIHAETIEPSSFACNRRGECTKLQTTGVGDGWLVSLWHVACTISSVKLAAAVRCDILGSRNRLVEGRNRLVA